MMVLVTINQEFGGLMESEKKSQTHVFKCFYLIHVCSMYLNVYQLLDLTSWIGTARIMNSPR